MPELLDMLLSPGGSAGSISQSETRRALLWGLSLGALGVATGFAAYVAWVSENSNSGFLISVAVVAVMAMVGESARQIIAHSGSAHASGGVLRHVTTILAGFFVVVLFEIVDKAWDKSSEELPEALGNILGSGFNDHERHVRLAAIIVVWIASGGLVAAWLVRRILGLADAQSSDAKPGRSVRAALARLKSTGWTAFREGLLTGVYAALISLLLLPIGILLTGAIDSITEMFAGPSDWHKRVAGLVTDAGIFGYLGYPALWFAAFLSGPFSHFGFIPLWAIAIVVLVAAWRRFRFVRWIASAGLLLALLFPVAHYVRDLLPAAGLYAALWVVPAFVLGSIAPLLRGINSNRWGIAACGTGVILALLALMQNWLVAEPLWPVSAIGAALTLLVGSLLLFAPPTREHLPLVAVACCFLSYLFASLAGLIGAGPQTIIEKTVFTGSPTPSETPQPLTQKTLPQPQSPLLFVIPGADSSKTWDISGDISGRLERIVAAKGHQRWLEAVRLVSYLDYLQDPEKYRRFAESWDNIPVELRQAYFPGSLELFSHAYAPWPRSIFEEEHPLPICPEHASHADCLVSRLSSENRSDGQAPKLSPVASPPKLPLIASLCQKSSRIECLAKLFEQPAGSPALAELHWSIADLKDWLDAVKRAVNSDLMNRWGEKASGVKLLVALSGAIGFFFTLAALIAWAIRDAAKPIPANEGNARLAPQ
jgi:hypothetical protein